MLVSTATHATVVFFFIMLLLLRISIVFELTFKIFSIIHPAKML